MKKAIYKNNFLFLILLLSVFISDAQADNPIAIIPKPLSMQLHSGHFVLSNATSITASSPDADVKQTVQWFTGMVATSTGYRLSTAQSSQNSISLSLNKQRDASLQDEGYLLKVTPTNITITANKAAGLFYGLQTVLQLLPPSIESVTASAKCSMDNTLC